MLGSKNRDYKTGGRQVEATLMVHIIRTKELEVQGMSHEIASSVAYKEIIQGELSRRIKDKIKELKVLRA